MVVFANSAESGAAKRSCLKKPFRRIFQANIRLRENLSDLHRAGAGDSLPGACPVFTFPSAAA
jgi:hypothetical protein